MVNKVIKGLNTKFVWTVKNEDVHNVYLEVCSFNKVYGSEVLFLDTYKIGDKSYNGIWVKDVGIDLTDFFTKYSERINSEHSYHIRFSNGSGFYNFFTKAKNAKTALRNLTKDSKDYEDMSWDMKNLKLEIIKI